MGTLHVLVYLVPNFLLKIIIKLEHFLMFLLEIHVRIKYQFSFIWLFRFLPIKYLVCMSFYMIFFVAGYYDIFIILLRIDRYLRFVQCNL